MLASRIPSWAILPITFAAMAVSACGRAGDPPPPRSSNLVIITIDTLRADALGAYGSPGGHTPGIDAFARKAFVFENAVSTMGTTFPAHASIFTGLYPKHHGVRWNGDALDDRFTTLAEILAAAGYETAAFVSWSAMLRHGGLHQGVATTGDPAATEPEPSLRGGDEVNAVAVPWLASRLDRPFFLWLHYYEPHAPYRLTPFARRQLTGYRGPLAEGASVKTVYALGREIPWSPEEARALRALYDGEVRDADRLVGEVLAALRHHDRLSDTIVVIASDHGQALGENGQVGHGFLLSQPVLHVPLLIHIPGAAPRRISRRVSLVDLTPSLLELLELPAPPGLDGTSLVPVLRGDATATAYYFAEVRGAGDRLARLQQRFPDPKRLAEVLATTVAEKDPGAVAVFAGDLKGIWSRDELEVYDLSADPSELHPGIPDVGNRQLATLREAVSSYHDRTAVEDARRELSEAMRKELEALGYIQ